MTRRETYLAPALSEEYAACLRKRRIKEAARISPCFACLVPLLEALGWRDYERPVLEALPHFSSTLGVDEFRDVLVNLGYHSQPVRQRIQKLRGELTPALFVGDDGRVLLIRSRSTEGFDYFDGNRCENGAGPVSGRGTVYLFTDISAAQGPSPVPSEPWFQDLLRRFHGLTKHLLAMTLIINITTVAVPIFIMVVYDRVIGARTAESLPFLIAGISIVLLVELGMRVLRASLAGTVAARIDYLLGRETFRKLLMLPPIMTERSSVNTQLSKLRQFDAVRDFFTGQSALTLLEAPFMLLSIAMIGLLGGWLALVPCVTALVYFVFGALWLPRMRRHLKASANARNHKERIQIETFTGLRELKALAAENVWLSRFREAAAAAAAANRRVAVDQAVLMSVSGATMALSAAAVLYFGARSMLAGTMSVGAMIAVMSFSWRVLAPLQGILTAAFRVESITAGVRDINQLMALKSEASGRKASLLARDIAGRVSFERVSFRYGRDFDPALVGVSFEVPEKAFLAVVGPNGSGKSTLLKLVNGLYPIQSGSVYIDGIDTRQFNPTDLRRLVAYVPQNPSLFHGTIAQNLRLKDPLATDDDLRLACFRTGILKAVEALPQGFDTMVGDASTLKLSASMVRGICIARAFVRPAPIVVLDEPASGLDNDSDESLMLQLESLKGQATVLMASHRPSHIRLADRVLLIERGVATRMIEPDPYLASIYPPLREKQKAQVNG